MSCHCVFPSSTEECLATFVGASPDTALRVLVEPGMEGYVRLQQMAYCDGMGWYVQKSMVIPGDLLRPLVTELRKADCLIPRTQPARSSAPSTMRLAPAEGPVEEHVELRRA